uniref:ribosomal protein S20 n=1 Tax=Rhodaphanes brevistipitata TaxID=446136 RepID=UPI001FCDA8B1|nr:ribosomal protein S20 [Rhodaphanes brevistipitata]UNJ18528.1 ribosomal protein S20 [Rhodaphanes brevistipitata]
MTQKKSIIKRIKVAKRNNARNKIYKTSVKNLMKKCLLAIQEANRTDFESVNKQIAIVYSKIDKAVQKNVYHINNGARKKSRLAKALKESMETVS